MKILLKIISSFLLITQAYAAEVLFSPETYGEVNPSNDTFYRTYYDNKIKKAFRTLEDDENTLLIDKSDIESTTNSTHIASPLIHHDSKVRNVYINNDMKNTKVYIKQ